MYLQSKEILDEEEIFKDTPLLAPPDCSKYTYYPPYVFIIMHSRRVQCALDFYNAHYMCVRYVQCALYTYMYVQYALYTYMYVQYAIYTYMYVQYAIYTCVFNIHNIHVCTICTIYMYVQYALYTYIQSTLEVCNLH